MAAVITPSRAIPVAWQGMDGHHVNTNPPQRDHRVEATRDEASDAEVLGDYEIAETRTRSQNGPLTCEDLGRGGGI
jgi:hypothetical protein